MADANFTTYHPVRVQDGGVKFYLDVGTGKNISYAGQVVSMDTSGLVQVCDDTALEPIMGVAVTPQAAGKPVLIYGHGNIVNCLFCKDNASINAGDVVGVYSSKPGSIEAKTFQTIGNYSFSNNSGYHWGYNETRVLGIALEDFTGTLPISGKVLVMPQIVRETNISGE